MSLAETLDNIRAGAEKNIPAPTLALMHRATRELQEGGQLDNLIRPGERLPDFEMANQFGETVTGAELLADGPLVMTFYRGLW